MNQNYVVYLKNGGELRPERGVILRWTTKTGKAEVVDDFEALTLSLSVGGRTGVYVRRESAGRADVFLPISSIEAVEQVTGSPSPGRPPGR